jgi:L-alanine-DL-glutamate epimerase-like enolase superfamily enzyme
VPLLAGIGSKTLDGIPDEVDSLIEQGFTTLKVKVGFDVEDDLARVEKTRAAALGRALVRLDANRNLSRADGCRFARALNPEGLQLFEQPCGTDAWDDNAAVAAVSTVPIMLDESIYGVRDVERAGAIEGVAFCKIKLKRAGGIDNLNAAMTRCTELGMGAVVGDGVATEIGNWMEACSARLTSTLAGEGNGFLKSSVRLFAEPLAFERGAIVLKKGFRPHIDRDVLGKHTLATERFTAPRGSAGRATR